jgi:hypothetical protein
MEGRILNDDKKKTKTKKTRDRDIIKQEMEGLIEEEEDSSLSDLVMSKKDFDLNEIESLIMDVDDIPLYLSILLYGKNGTGKTRFLGTCPKPMVFDFREKGTLTIRGSGAKVVKIRTIDQIEQFFWYLATQKHPFKTLGFDTVTLMNDISLKSVMGVDQWEVGDAVQMAHKRHYGENTQLMKFWIMNFRDIENMHKVFLCQQKTLNDEDVDDESFEVIPALSDAVLKSLGAAVDIIAQLNIKEVAIEGTSKVKPVYRARVGPSERYLTKFRLPMNSKVKVPMFIKDPTFEKFMSYYSELEKEATGNGEKKQKKR